MYEAVVPRVITLPPLFIPHRHNMPRFRRSRGGCATCKRRKRKCDETRPACLACRAKGIECDGYGIRLRWGSDNVASPSHHANQTNSKPNSGSESMTLGTPESNAGENSGSPPAAPSETSPVSLPSYQLDESPASLSSPAAINEETQLAFQRCQSPSPGKDISGEASADVVQSSIKESITSIRRLSMNGSNHSSQRKQNHQLPCS